MFRYFRALDPARSLATAFAWFAVALSLAIAFALVSVGDYAANSMLAAAVVSTRIGATRLFAFIGPVLQLARRSQQSYARAQQFEISVFQSAVFLG